tara:strand:- start:455 stop:667 length:213 start_codon:yes stop_codon:yes gene_type:complete
MTKVKEELIKHIETIAEDLQEAHLLNIRDLMNTINENQYREDLRPNFDIQLHKLISNLEISIAQGGRSND